MIKKIQNFCFKNKLFYPNQSLVVGFSGGPDSTALVIFLNYLKKSWRLKIQLMHINYGLRGKDSVLDEKFCIKLAKKFNLPLKVVAYKKNKKFSHNLEEAFRDFRYLELEKERKAKNFDWIAVGHTLDDQIETFFLNLLRGSGLGGLVALKPKNGKIIRPFLGTEKVEILNFLKEQKQFYRLDKSNFNQDFTRNRIRGSLLPLLQKEYNPQVKSCLADLSEHLRDILIWMEVETEKIFQELVKKEKSTYILNQKCYCDLPRSLRKSLFRLLIKKTKGDLRDISANFFWEFEKVAFSQKSKSKKIVKKNLEIYQRKKQFIFKTL